MNLQDFSLLKEDNDSYQIGHPKGRSMFVPKKGLSDKAQTLISQLKKEQHLAEGTPEGTEPINSESITDSPAQIVADATNASPLPEMTAAAEQQASSPSLGQGNPGEAPSAAASTSASPGAAASTSTPNPTPEGGPSELPGPFNTTQSLQSAKQAISGGVAAQGKAGKAESEAYGQAAQALQNLPTANDILAKNQEADQKAEAYFRSLPPIDQDRYWNNKSTVSKVTSAIALFLGGFGAGMSKSGQNPAATYLNNAIANDIESQKNDQSKAMNLWKMNREALGNQQQADLATQNQMLAIAKAKMDQAAAATAGPLAAQQAATAKLGIDQQIATNNWMRSRLQGGAPGTEMNHVNDLNVMQQVRPDFYKDMQSKYVPGVGIAQVPLTENDRAALKTYDELQESLNRAINFAKTKGTTMYGTAANAEADSIRQDLVTGFQKLHGLNRLSDVDLKLNLSNIDSPGALRTQAALAQYNNFGKELASKRATDYKQLGIQPFKQAPQDQQAIAWARANPGTPQAAQILALNKANP